MFTKRFFGLIPGCCCAHGNGDGFSDEGDVSEEIVALAVPGDGGSGKFGRSEEFPAECPVLEVGTGTDAEGRAGGTKAEDDGTGIDVECEERGLVGVFLEAGDGMLL